MNKTKSPTKIRLAYPVKKQKEAFLVILDFNLRTEKLKKLEKELRSENRVLRYLISTKPQPKISLVGDRKTSRKPKPKVKKVKLKEIEKKLEEILGTD